MSQPLYIQRPSCQHFNACSGCSADLSAVPPVWIEVLDAFKDRLAPVLHQGPSSGWRCRAKLAVRGTPDLPVIGLFKRHSHEAVPIPLCLVHHPKINQAVHIVRNWMRRHQLVPYQEKGNKGDLRYLQCVVERSSGKVQIAFVLNFKGFSSVQAQRWQALLPELSQEGGGHFWHSIWVNFNDRKTNTIFGDHWSCLWGELYLWESFGPVSVCFQPASFAQANLNLFESLLGRIADWVPDKSKVAEFYAGVGAIGLYIASKCRWIRCEEINPYAEACFSLSKEKLPFETASKISFYTGSAEETLQLMHEADVAIVDPPRKGLGIIFINELSQSAVKKLIYVSCGWSAFKKDSQHLLADGWRLSELEGYVFFPGSNHIELLACFERNL